MNLSDLPNWPVKKEFIIANPKYPNHVGSKTNPYNDGYNQALQDCDLTLSCDVEAMAKELFEVCEYPNPDSWEHEDTNRDIWRTRASIICEQLPKFLKLEKRN